MSGAKVPELKLINRAQKTLRARTDDIAFTQEEAAAWPLPPFQRDLKINYKVIEIGEQIKADDGVLPGMLTFAILKGQKYLLDGQHRRESFRLSGIDIGYASVRIIEFDDISEMANEYYRLNQPIVRMTPDDMLKALEAGSDTLKAIRKNCNWIGYSNIRRGDSNPIVSMSLVLRAWSGAKAETPVAYGSPVRGRGGRSGPADLVALLTDEESESLLSFLSICFAAWGKDKAAIRLYGALNLGLCAWLYRRIVIEPYSSKTVKMTDDLFKKCLMSLAADTEYPDWLVGRALSDRDRSPAYSRLRSIFVNRIELETGSRVKFPKPEWATS